jgi:molybdenum cofactor cytidylyltransferase
MIKNIVYGLIISAGLSGRIGQFKPLLNYKGNSFLQNITAKLSEVCDKIIIVTGNKASEVKENIEQLNTKISFELVFNPDYELGSLCGSTWITTNFLFEFYPTG